MAIKVAQIGTGNVGRQALTQLITDPRFELTGVWVSSDSKAGKDAAELVGLDNSTGITATASLEWLIPKRLGNWYVKYGFQYYNIINDSLLLAQTIVGTASSFATAHREVWVGYAGLGFTF